VDDDSDDERPMEVVPDRDLGTGTWWQAGVHGEHELGGDATTAENHDGNRHTEVDTTDEDTP
jgi:hypothetical protein